jgi:hypothetical protein
MSFTYNNVVLLGRAGGEAKVSVVGAKETQLAKFSMVTGNEKTTCWHNIQAWGQMAAVACNIRKGDEVAVHGSIANNKVGDKTYSCINANLIVNYGKKGQAPGLAPDEIEGENSPELRIANDADEIPF